jgi:hypothetical protein
MTFGQLGACILDTVYCSFGLGRGLFTPALPMNRAARQGYDRSVTGPRGLYPKGLFNFAQSPPARSCLICTTPGLLNDPVVPTPGVGLLLIAPAGVFSRCRCA